MIRMTCVAVCAGGDSSGMSDSDKITLQLYLDVQEYGQQMTRLGLTPSSLQSYQSLLQAVTPPPAVLAAAPAAAASGAH